MTKDMTTRIMKDLSSLAFGKNNGYFAVLKTEDDIRRWRVFIDGPPGTPYEGGRFELSVKLPAEYPFRSPTVEFVTKVYHCNVNKSSGNICLDILSGKWSAALKAQDLIVSIISLLSDPNPNSPLESHIASLYKSDRKTHDTECMAFTKEQASDNLRKRLGEPDEIKEETDEKKEETEKKED